MATMMAQKQMAQAAGLQRTSAPVPKVGRTMPVVRAAAATSSFQGAAVAPKLRQAAGRRQAARASRRTAVQTQAKLGDTLNEFLIDATQDIKLRTLVTSLSECIRTIAYKVRTASCAGTACVNSFGDEQLAVDMVADKLLFEACRYSHVVKLACSEEVPEPVDVGGSGFSVAFDPLDGSSVIDCNFAVGTIIGIWPGDKLDGITGRDQAAACMGVLGPRTVFVLAIKGYPGTHEFLLQDDGKFIHVKETTEIGEGKMYAPGNLRATSDNPQYEKLLNYYVQEKYTLRYTGGMVPDVFQILVKEKGVFTNVTSPSTKAKLRILFEVAPLGLMVENAGGYSSADGKQISALDVPINNCDQRTQICFGSYGEVKRFEEFMFGSAPRFQGAAAAK
uniref:Sedoheptulose-1,7-bisphosphatase, chloroplastic n=1 Tax=Dunaliella tertiolecta TaxID=3047 RepID=A0A7S3VUA4_DUNTE|mmetsp:Transcript_14913/g.40218  ORF Transcript_14913/g.40218 Transcript_14913/m.40218 type:complete len:391 (-) Transcript_14913:426-1598(-)|eukprot:CAMPEP_0202345964 /NCGR_PEP_ID=MMETSP1126-20121109/4964_1 /ASSEMBLY_ACC=CAM_ASM_000457 /TAXON_ID=3047 /ORGANISM="Dunaliella tertiolecta, Strain CCMP1320" /LENGTH=390 /DNA_ID=CAMNT_0048937317 /DNA_START=62 /DNA_END=1234 /DNA_ORIENTATION=-